MIELMIYLSIVSSLVIFASASGIKKNDKKEEIEGDLKYRLEEQMNMLNELDKIIENP